MDRARGLAAYDDTFVGPDELPGLEAEDGVEAGEALDVAELGGPPLLVAHEQQRQLLVALGMLGERPQRAEREHDPALHVDRPRADELLARALERLMFGVRHDGVVVPDEQRL